jgi:hypothetical protein
VASSSTVCSTDRTVWRVAAREDGPVARPQSARAALHGTLIPYRGIRQFARGGVLDLRHTGATLAAQTGASLAHLMKRLGHSSMAAARRYIHAVTGATGRSRRHSLPWPSTEMRPDCPNGSREGEESAV